MKKNYLEYENIQILHSDFPDVFVKHIPEMSLSSFLCNFGGLLGMWLGLSLDGIFKQFFRQIIIINYRKYINFIKLKIITSAYHFNCKFQFSNRINTIRVKPRET